MTDFGWKSRRSREEDIFPDEDASQSRVRPTPSSTSPSGKTNKGDEDAMEGSSIGKGSPDGDDVILKDKDRRHKHKHNKHHSKHKKSRRRSRSRSKSKSRSPSSRKRGRSRSRSRDRHNRHHRDRDRDERSLGSGSARKGQRPRSRSGSRSRKWDRPGGIEQCKNVGKIGDYNTVSNNDEDLDLANTAQPFSTGPVPLAASKLKAEIEKRKQLWSKKDKPTETATSSTAWKKTAFSDDNDGRVSAKFKRLMGIKDAPDSTDDQTVSNMSDKQRQEYFANLEKQYEVARATTHTQRGLGLGFSSRSLFPR